MVVILLILPGSVWILVSGPPGPSSVEAELLKTSQGVMEAELLKTSQGVMEAELKVRFTRVSSMLLNLLTPPCDIAEVGVAIAEVGVAISCRPTLKQHNEEMKITTL